jgi:ABC-2 type transport system permease protein
MNAFAAIIKKELKLVAKEKTIMIAIGIQLFIASFSSAILIGMLSFYDPDSIGLNARVSINVGIIGDANDPLIGFLRGRNARVTVFSSSENAEVAFQAGAIDAIVFIPEAIREDHGGVVDMKLFLPESETRSTLILMILKEPMKQYENYLRKRQGVHVRYTDIEGLPSTTYEFRYSVIIPILMFFPAFVAGSMVVDSISEELENHTLDTLWSAPLSLNVIFGAKVVAALVLAVVQCALWSMLLRFNRIAIQNLGLVLLLAAVLAAIIAVGAAFVAVYFRDRERSQFVYSLFTLLSVGMGYFFDASPITVMTRLAAGGYHAGLADVAIYGVLLLVLLAAFFSTAKKLIAVPS